MPNYIVVFKDDVPQTEVDKAVASVESAGGTIKQRYDGTVLNGFAATIPEAHLESLQKQQFKGDSAIDYIEPDGEVTIQ